jgi:hypothetical protein
MSDANKAKRKRASRKKEAAVSTCKHSSTTRLTEKGLYTVASCDDCGQWIVWKLMTGSGLWYREAVLAPLPPREVAAGREEKEK